MIASIEDLIAFTEKEAAHQPRIAERIVLRRLPDHSNARSGPPVALPPVYLRVMWGIRLKGVSIGYLNLWPGGPWNRGSIEEDLVRENRLMPAAIAALTKPAGLVRVASYEADPVFVGARGSSAGEDVAYYVDHERPVLTRLAHDFEVLMLAAGNIRWCGEEYSGSTPEAVTSQYLDCLRRLGLTGTEIENWRRIAEVAFL